MPPARHRHLLETDDHGCGDDPSTDGLLTIKAEVYQDVGDVAGAAVRHSGDDVFNPFDCRLQVEGRFATGPEAAFGHLPEQRIQALGCRLTAFCDLDDLL